MARAKRNGRKWLAAMFDGLVYAVFARELAVTLRCSPANVEQHVARLARRGLVTWRGFKSRTLRLTGAPFVVVAP